MNITTFRKKTNYGGVMDMFSKATTFIGGWSDQHIVYVKMTRPNLVRQYISNTIFKLQYKIKNLDKYEVYIYENGGMISCGPIKVVFVGVREFDLARMIWNARSLLIKEVSDVFSGEGLYMFFKDDPSYSIRRLADIQRNDVNLGDVIDRYSFLRGPFGVISAK